LDTCVLWLEHCLMLIAGKGGTI